MTTQIQIPEMGAADPLDYYYQLCAIRDEVNAKNAPLEAELESLVAEQERLRVQAEKVAAQIDDNRGRESWITLKKRIAFVARGLGHIPPR